MIELFRTIPPSYPSSAERELIEWLDQRSPPPVVLTTNVQPLAAHSRGRFHWVQSTESARYTRAVLQNLPIDYVIVYDRERMTPFIDGLYVNLQLIREFGTGTECVRVYKPLPLLRHDR
jgi:hypothetical protein